MFGWFKKKVKSDFPANDLEALMQEIASDPAELDRFYTKLLWSDFIVLTDGTEEPEEGDEEDSISIRFITLDSGHIPIFSSQNRIYDKGIIKEEMSCVQMKARSFLKLTKGHKLVLNPYSDYPKELVPMEVESLLDGTIYDKLKEMQQGLSDEEANALQALFTKAMNRQEKLIYINGFETRELSEKERGKLQSSINDFQMILERCPDHWQSMFGIAKAQQRMGEHEKALRYLEQALALEDENASVALEASIEAVNLRNLEKALTYSEEAIKRNAEDFTLWGNYALNLLVAGKNTEAKDSIEKAIEMKANDKINQRILQIVIDVIEGKRERPSFDDLFPK